MEKSVQAIIYLCISVAIPAVGLFFNIANYINASPDFGYFYAEMPFSTSSFDSSCLKLDNMFNKDSSLFIIKDNGYNSFDITIDNFSSKTLHASRDEIFFENDESCIKPNKTPTKISQISVNDITPNKPEMLALAFWGSKVQFHKDTIGSLTLKNNLPANKLNIMTDHELKVYTTDYFTHILMLFLFIHFIIIAFQELLKDGKQVSH